VADLAEVRAAIEAVEQQLSDARAQLEDAETSIERLNQERAEAEGRVAITRRAVTDFEERLKEQRQALVDATREAALEGYKRAVKDRDAAVEQVVGAVRALIAAFEGVGVARNAVAGAAQEARRLGAVVPQALPPEPRVPDDEWSRLHELIGASSQARLDEELIAAAARSGNYLRIKELPPHLREAARARLTAPAAGVRRGSES
jgi:hypothetical protein